MTDEAPSIVELLRRWDGEGDPPELPDEAPPDPTQLRFSSGSLDGIYTHHMGGGGEGRLRGLVRRIGRRDPAGEIVKALRRLVRHPGEAERRRLYALLLADEAIGTVDEVVERVAADRDLLAKLAPPARALVEEATDREPLKLAIALLGISGGPEDVPTLLALARHDEFTLYCVVAIIHVLEDPVDALWEVAKSTRAWGKIQAVERLAPMVPLREDVRRWLLTDGCANEVMDEYLGYVCATGGGLADALAGDVDDELLDGACTIVSALCRGGPAEDLADYEDGPRAVELLVGELEGRCTTLERLATVRNVMDWLDYLEDPAPPGWTPELRGEIARRCTAILGGGGWPERVEEAFLHGPEAKAWLALSLAPDVGVDLWEHVFARVRDRGPDPGLVYTLVTTRDPARRERVVRWLEETLPLDRIASGPTEHMFEAGEDVDEASSLVYAVQAMSDESLYSEQLVAAALLAPVIGTRNMALNALEAHPRSRWGPAVERALERLASEEPNDEVRARVRALA